MNFSARFAPVRAIDPGMLTARTPIRLPALFVDAPRVLIDEHGEIDILTRDFNARIKAWGEESCRREELHLRKRLDAYLRRYIREVNQLKAASPASSMASLFDDLLRNIDATPNREAIEQLESLLDTSPPTGRS